MDERAGRDAGEDPRPNPADDVHRGVNPGLKPIDDGDGGRWQLGRTSSSVAHPIL